MNNKRRRRKLPVILEREEVKKLLSIPNTRYLTSLRDKSMLKLMINCGLRVSEVVKLRPGDLNLSKGKLRIVAGKGGVDRDIPFIPEDTVNILREWKARKPKSDYFFSTIRNNKSGGDYNKSVIKKNGKTKEWNIKYNSIRGGKLAVRTVQSMIKSYSKRAGINNKVVSPHVLRHTFATNYYRNTKDLEALRILLGHANISTTQIYVTLANIDTENGMRQFKEF